MDKRNNRNVCYIGHFIIFDAIGPHETHNLLYYLYILLFYSLYSSYIFCMYYKYIENNTNIGFNIGLRNKCVINTSVRNFCNISHVNILLHFKIIYLNVFNLNVSQQNNVSLEKRKNRKNIYIFCQEVTPSASSGYIFKFCTSML